jgi:hypothetical protein
MSDHGNVELLNAIDAGALGEFARVLERRQWSPADLREALFRSISLNRDDAARLVLRGSLQADFTDDYGTTALMLAARHDRLWAIKALLDRGARINACDIVGWTALFYAARGQHADAVRELLDAGADIAHRDSEGHSVLYVARRAHFSMHLPFGIVIAGVRPTLYASEAYRVLSQAGAPR